jgi:tight adherence protein B
VVRRSAALGGLAVVVLFLASTASAATRVRGVAVANYPHVSVTVATDQTTPLSPSNVRVVENGTPVTVDGVTLLETGESRVDAILAVDVSNSMRGVELETALAAASAFLAEVPSGIDVGVLAFNKETSVVSPVAGDRAAVMAATSAIQPTTGAGTALFDTVVTASEMFEGGGQHNLVLLTDGRNTRGEADLATAIATAQEGGVSVFTIGLEGGDPDERTLRTLSTQTGGAYTSLAPEDLGAAYRSLALELGQQYVITYRSKTPPGTQADVVVDLPGGSASTSILMPPPSASQAMQGDGFLEDLVSGRLGMILVVVLAFLAALSVISLIRSMLASRRRRRELEGRLSSGAGRQAGADESEGTGWVPRPLSQAAEWGAETARAAGPVARQLERAGWKLHVGDFLAPALMIPMGAAVVVFVLFGPLLAVLVGVILVPIPFLILSHAATKRIDELQAQLPDVLMILASSLRAGHSFLQALDSVAKEVDDPAATEFARTLAEIQLGRNVDDAMDALSQRVGSQDLEWAVTAINIQRKVGGNLAEVLETVANTIRQREAVRRQIKVLSAEGRYSVYILVALPPIILAYLSVVNPGYLDPLTSTPSGIMLLIGGVLLMLVGFVWMRKVVRLDV